MFLDLRNKYMNVNYNKVIGKGLLLKYVKKTPIHKTMREITGNGILTTSNIVGGVFNNNLPIIKKVIKPKNIKGGELLNFNKTPMPNNGSALLNAVKIPISGKKKIRNNLKISI